MNKFAVSMAAAALTVTLVVGLSAPASASPRLSIQPTALKDHDGTGVTLVHRRRRYRRGGGLFLALPFVGLGYGSYYHRPNYGYYNGYPRYRKRHYRKRHYGRRHYRQRPYYNRGGHRSENYFDGRGGQR